MGGEQFLFRFYMNIIYTSIEKNKNEIFNGNSENLNFFVKIILEFYQILMNLFKKTDQKTFLQVFFYHFIIMLLGKNY